MKLQISQGVNTAANKFNSAAIGVVQRFQNAAVFRDAKRFHINKFMIFSGLWFQPMEAYLPTDSNAEMSSTIKKESKWKSRLLKLWCIFASLVVLVPSFLRYSVCWVWHGDNAIYWMQDYSSILGGSKYYHLPLLTFWALVSVVVLFLWWRVQYSGDMLSLIKPFVAIHYPERAKKLR